jgi:hypothetical protein
MPRYGNRMGVALIAAIAGIVGVLIREIGTRIDQRDLRNRLTKDVDILGKLDQESDEYQALKKHISESVLGLVAAEKAAADKFAGGWLDRSIVVGGAFAAASWFALHYFELGRFASLVKWAGLVALAPAAFGAAVFAVAALYYLVYGTLVMGPAVVIPLLPGGAEWLRRHPWAERRMSGAAAKLQGWTAARIEKSRQSRT